ncbi:MAG: hypothetical protein AB7U76_24935 [Pirellulales bacterium]
MGSGASDAAKVSTFISYLALHFGEMKFDADSEAQRDKAHTEWLRSMIRHLSGYSQECLDRAQDAIISGRKYKSFPLLSEIIDACNKAQKALNDERPKLNFGSKNIDYTRLPSWSSERIALADELVMCEMGRQAAKEGWIGSLHGFCCREMRLPQNSYRDKDGRPEIDGVKYDAKAVVEQTSKATRGELGPFSPALAQMGKELLKRREFLANMVLHGEVRS